MGGSDLRKTNAPGACLLRKGDPFSRRLRDRLILTTPPAPNGVLITRLVFFLLNLLKQISEGRFPGSKSSMIRAVSAFGKFNAEWYPSPVYPPPEKTVIAVAFAANENEQASVLSVVAHDAV